MGQDNSTENSQQATILAQLRADALQLDLQESLAEAIHLKKIAENSVRELEARNRLFQLLTKVTTSANQAESIHDGLRSALQEICAYVTWDMGHCYIVPSGSERREDNHVWHNDLDMDIRVFQKKSGLPYSMKSPSLVDTVLHSEKPYWTNDINESEEVLRREEGQNLGLKSAYAFPIFFKKQVLGVMEFFSCRPVAPDMLLMGTLADIGVQLGHLILRKRSEDKAQLFEEVVRNAKDGIMITRGDLGGEGPEITYVNDALTNITGYAAKELWSKTPKILQGKKTERKTLNRLRLALEAGKPFQGELLNYSKKGRPYWLDVGIFPIRNSEGKVSYFAAIERDITERKEAEKRLLKAKEEAEAANVAKSDFLANMSHELRTPMNGIMGMTSLLVDTEVTKEQQELIGTIEQSSQNLLAILNDILDLSKIEAGMVENNQQPFELAEMLEALIKPYQPVADEKDIALVLQVAPEVPRYIEADDLKLQQILRNLIGNALKFTTEGQVKLSVSCEGGLLRFEVRDTGIGIPPEKQTHIFDKFTQVEESTTRNYGGTGLGLAICSELLNLLGGAIGLESALGKGSAFWFTLPLVEATAEAVLRQPYEPITPAQGAKEGACLSSKILLVDDHPVNRMFASKMLTKMGYESIEEAEHGREALEKAKQGGYDVVLMDCQMPEMDGYEATAAIRKLEVESGEHLPIIAMTANAMVGDREKCLNAGMDDYLSKPVDKEKLNKMLQKWLGCASVPLPPEQASERSSKEGLPVLDWEHLALFTEGDLEEEKEIFTLFFAQAEQSMQEMQDAVSGKRPEAWHSAAHRLKGAAANLGANALAKSCQSAEQSPVEACAL